MAAAVVLTPTVDPSAVGSILTFLTPTAYGCGMSCSYCFIDRRHERTDVAALQPEDYAWFIREAAALQRVAAVTIQGREPLEPHSLTWTRAILEAAASAETGIVTNGLWLKESVPLLAAWKCMGVTVSIDADRPETHDRLRRTPGAWLRAMEGLRALVDQGSTARVVVNSLLFKGNTNNLFDLPRHLADVGVTLWSLSPLLKFDEGGRPSAVISSREWIDAISVLSDRAARYGVSVLADDEFRTFDEGSIPGVVVRTLSRPDGIMRMGPDGRCSFGTSILTGVTGQEFYWRRDTRVSEVMRRVAH